MLLARWLKTIGDTRAPVSGMRLLSKWFSTLRVNAYDSIDPLFCFTRASSESLPVNIPRRRRRPRRRLSQFAGLPRVGESKVGG